MWHGQIRSLLRRGYGPDCTSRHTVRCLLRVADSDRCGAIPTDELVSTLGPQAPDGIGLVLPTYVGRSSLADNLCTLDRLLDQLDPIVTRPPRRPAVLFVGMQWDPGERPEAEMRLHALGERSRRLRAVSFVGMSLPRSRKVDTLNVAFSIAASLSLCGIAWVDDDVRLGVDCLLALTRRFFERGARGAVGARKIPQPRRYTASRVLHWAKERMHTPATAYPHGCCMMVGSDCMAKGIPARYTCDDDYFCFSLLRPGPDPFERMEVVPDATCMHTVGGPAREIYHRVRRSLLSSVVMHADFPPAVSRLYFSRIQFHGLWPLAPFDATQGWTRGAVKCALKALYFVWFCQVAAELLARGAFRRPLREIPWAGYREYSLVPDPGALGLSGTPAHRS